MMRRISCGTGRTEKNESFYISDYVVFDLETTGISARTDAVVEISAVKVRDGKVADEFSSLVNPERPIPFRASAVNGITDSMVRNCPVFETVLADFLEFTGRDPLVGHNISSFDMKFISRDAMRYWGKTIGNPVIDTLPLARKVLPQLSHYKLTDLAEYYGISPEGAHRALNDCRMNQQIFERLAEEKPVMVQAAEGEPSCPRCGRPLKQRNGRFGVFWGCTGYPACRYTQNIL